MYKRVCPECGEHISAKKILKSTYKHGENDFKCRKCNKIIHVDWGKGVVYLMLPVLFISLVSFDTGSAMSSVVIKAVIAILVGVPISCLITVRKVPIYIKIRDK